MSCVTTFVIDCCILWISADSLRIVEDILKKNTNFKLPKEHTPRI